MYYIYSNYRKQVKQNDEDIKNVQSSIYQKKEMNTNRRDFSPLQS